MVWSARAENVSANGAELTAPSDETVATQLAMVGSPGEVFDGDRYSLYGGCPALLKMDRLTITSPVGGLASAALTYTDGDGSDEGRVAGVRAVRPGGGQAVTCGFDVSALPSRMAIRCLLQTVLEEGFGIQVPSPGACSNGVDVPGPGLPLAFDLARPEPTPFVDRTRIAFTLRERGSVSLTVHDLLGRRVATLANGPFDRGAHARTWDGRTDRGTRVAAGVYFVRLVSGEEQATRKLVRLR